MKTFLLALALLPLAVPAAAQDTDPQDIELIVLSWDDGPFTLAPCGSDAIPEVEVYLSQPATGMPVQIPASDIWLEGADVVFCPGGNEADSSSYAPDPGYTTFTGIRGGGLARHTNCDHFVMHVVARGNLSSNFTWAINSPDCNGDLQVTLADFVCVAQGWGHPDPCLDFGENGGAMNLAEFAQFAIWFRNCSCD